jgi:hypothetical protein
MNRDQKLLEEAYKAVYESDADDVVKRYIERGCKGDLNLEKTSITSLPAELKIVRGQLSLYKSKIESFPGGLEVEGDLDASFTDIKSLPKGLRVKGNLFLMSCEKLESIPEDLQVRGDLNLNYTNITSLPTGLNVGSLRLAHSKIASLPKKLILRGNLDLAGTSISSLPSDLRVEGYLFLQGSGIKKVSQIPLDLEPTGIESYDFTLEDFEKHKKVTKQLSKDFDVSALDDF